MAWGHHIGYLIFMALTLFYDCPMIFVAYFPLEVSTIFLASGHIWKSARKDLLFGVTFFIFRILYHGALSVYLLYHLNVSPMKISVFGSYLTLVLHIFWWKNWLLKYLNQKQKNN
jgi:hypothetical protein